MNDLLPKEILDFIRAGKITQWKKYPNKFFVVGVEKARLTWDCEKKTLLYSYLSEIPGQEQYAIFRDVFNELKNSIK